MTDQEKLANHAIENTNLTPEERETVIRFSRYSDQLLIHSREKTIFHWLLEHPGSEITFLNTPEGKIKPSEWTQEVIHGVKAKLPIGCLLLSGSARKTENHCRITGEI